MEERNKIIINYIKWIIKKRFYILFFLFLLIVISLILSRNINFDFSYENFFPNNDINKTIYDNYKNIYNDEDLVISIFIKNHEGINNDLIIKQKKISKILQSLGAQNINYLGNLKKYELSHNDNGFYIKTSNILENKTTYSSNEINYLKKIISSKDLYKDIFYSDKSEYYPIYTNIDEKTNNYKERKIFLDELNREIKKLNYSYILIGIPVLRTDSINLLFKDLRIYLILGLFLGLALILICFKSIKDIVISILTILPAIILIFGLIPLLNYNFTTLFSVVPIIMMIIGISDIIHTLIKLKSIKKTNPKLSIDELLISTFSYTTKVCFLTSLTTSIGFLSLFFTNLIALQQFSIIISIGIMILYLIFIHLFPILIYLFYKNGNINTNYIFQNTKFFRKSANFVIKYYKIIFIITIFWAILFCISFIKLEKGGYIKGDMKKNNPLFKSFQLIEDEYGGIFLIHVLIDLPKDKHLYSYDTLVRINKFHEMAEQFPEITKVLSPVSIIKLVQKNKKITRGMAKTIEQIIKNSDNTIISSYYKKEKNKARMLLFIKDCGYKRINEIVRSLDNANKINETSSIKFKITGTVIMISRIYDLVVKNFIVSFFILLAIVFLIFFMIFKSIPLTLFALIPNFLPILFVLSYMSIFKIAVEPTNIFVLNIVFGIATDDTIHLLYWIHNRLKNRDTINQSIISGLTYCSPAMLITSVALVAGFSLCIFSSFLSIYYLGILSALALAIAFICDIYVTPSLVCFLQKPILLKRNLEVKIENE